MSLPIALLQFKSHGEDTGDGGLPYTSMPTEDIPMRYPALNQRVHQRHGYVLLAGDIAEALGAIFPCKYLMGHRSQGERAAPSSL